MSDSLGIISLDSALSMLKDDYKKDVSPFGNNSLTSVEKITMNFLQGKVPYMDTSKV